VFGSRRVSLDAVHPEHGPSVPLVAPGAPTTRWRPRS
jgi:hypothetical protein